MQTTRILAISVLVWVVALPAGVAKADFTFGMPVNLGPTVNTSSGESVTVLPQRAERTV